MGKRDREVALDPAVEDALVALQSTLERGGSELKLRALDKVIAVVDPSDDLYTAQKALVANDAAFFVTERGGADAEVCHAEEAAQLLRGLAARFPAVRTLLDEREVPTIRNPPSCCIS